MPAFTSRQTCGLKLALSVSNPTPPTGHVKGQPQTKRRKEKQPGLADLALFDWKRGRAAANAGASCAAGRAGALRPGEFGHLLVAGVVAAAGLVPPRAPVGCFVLSWYPPFSGYTWTRLEGTTAFGGLRKTRTTTWGYGNSYLGSARG